MEITPHFQPSQQPQPQPLAIEPPPPPTPFPQSNHQLLLPFHPPTTPTPTSTSFRKKRRSKFLRLDTTTPSPVPKKPKQPLSNQVTPPCTECGKTFWSWKALFGHMRCHPERQWRGINPPPHLRRPPSLPPPPTPTPNTAAIATADDHDVAASLLLLASGPILTVEPTARFECSSCKKTFGSHQALGGHRASHKNVKGCFAITKSITTITTTDVEEDNHNNNNHHHQFMIMQQSGQTNEEAIGLGLSLGLGVGHRCGVCMKVFPTGQALGGHMRCHWEKSEASTSSVGPAIGPVTPPSEAQCGLDLNLPAQLHEDGASSSCAYYSNSNSDSNMRLELRLGM